MADRKKSGGIAGLFRQAGQAAKAAKADDPGSNKIFSILEYIEEPWGLATRLYPVQRFIVKLYYNLELDKTLPDDPNLRIQIRDPFTGIVKYELTEYDYLKYLHNEGRCNIGEQDHDRRELILACGRRSGKSTLSGIFASYEVYRLLNQYNPQAYYGLPNGNRIQLVSVATDRDQAGILFNEVTTHLAKCDYFAPFMANNTQSVVNFRTPYDIDKYGPNIRQEDGKFTSLNGKATIRLTFKSCNGKGLRGHGNILVVLDEFAHFLDKGATSAEDIYKAVVPSTTAYVRKNAAGRPIRDPNTGEEARVEARVILISSPLGRSGKFFDLFDQAMRGGPGAHNLLAIQAPTWEVNPSIAGNALKEHYHANPPAFNTEFGANFSDQVCGWIEREADLQACINPQRRPILKAVPRMPHQMGIDVGLIGDGTGIVITHVDQNKIVLDYHEKWQARRDWRETNPHLQEPTTAYARTLLGQERLDFDEIANWIRVLCTRFHITAGLFDRWNGIPLEQRLHKMGLRQFQSQFFTRDMSSKIYQSAKSFIYDERLVLYDYPIPERASEGKTKHSPFIDELLSLQANQVSKNIVIVAAPDKVDAHDDLADAFVRAVHLSTDILLNTKHISHGYGAGAAQAGNYSSGPMNATSYAKMKARLHGAIGMGDRYAPRRSSRLR